MVTDLIFILSVGLGDNLDKLLIEIIFYYREKDNSFFTIEIIVNFHKIL